MSADRRRLLGWAIGLGAWTASHTGRAAEQAATLHWRESATLALGTTVGLRLAHADAEVAERALAAAMAAVARVDAALSLFRPDSALSRLNRAGSLASPPVELVAALRLALEAARASGGLFDPTVQPLWRTWYEAHLAGHTPADREVAAARARLGVRGIEINEAQVRLARPGMALTLNGIAQGFAADRARAVLQGHGIEHALLDTGEWWPMGKSESGQPWRLGIAQPGVPATAPSASASVPTHSGARRQSAATVPAAVPATAPAAVQATLLATLVADGRAVACSADDKLSFTADRREHHILDPRSGHSPRQLSMVVVAAHSAAWADALSKPLFMGSAEQALVMARRFGVDVLAVEKSGRWRSSAGLRLA